jgi:organic hydroperoxide reductase OsmC/OhrA
MGEYRAIVDWKRNGAAFTDLRYSRGHRWRFDGVEVPASASPHVVPPPMSIEAAVDPEEAFVASLASCHMLTFLWIAARRGFVVETYRDEAVGIMAKNASGRLAITRVTLHPEIRYEGRTPAVDEEKAMHHASHEECFIANSVTTEVRCEPIGVPAAREDSR